MQRSILALATAAALLGAAGVALAAASAHAGGGELARTAADFLILHAAALLALAACARAFSDDVFLARSTLFAGAALGVGVLLFSADLSARAFAGARLFPLAAPAGGSLLILGWLALAAVFAAAAFRARR
jgi:uncharacterized membrane protein YgdD (TMEM256/DUF423 family)